MMQRVLLVTAVVIVTTAGVHTQSTPNLVGTWTLDASRSDPAPAAPAGGRGRGNQNQMAITQTPTEITIVISGASYIYNLDGSERTGPPGGETKSKIAWDSGALIVTWKREYFAGPEQGYLTSTGKDTYALDGNVLTVERTIAAPSRRTQTWKTVYVKAP